MAVCVLGSINRDIVARVAVLPRPGETVTASETFMLAGGKGANQAVAAARMGASVRMIGAVGRDADGTALVAALAAEGVDIGAVAERTGLPTGAAFITLDEMGENQIIVAPGANATITAAEASFVDRNDRVCIAQLEVPLAAVLAFFSAAGNYGALRMLNAAPALADSMVLFALTDLLIVNETELAHYAGLPPERIDRDAAIAVRALFSRPEQAAIVTLGANGAVLVEADRMVHLPARRADVIDTTGAGDCFCGSLAALLAEGMPLAIAAARAGIAASICVGRLGAGPAMPWRREVEALAPRE